MYTRMITAPILLLALGGMLAGPVGKEPPHNLPPVLSGASIVAAGILQGDGRSPRILNGLRIVSISSGELVITFDGYSPDSSDHFHIVKVMVHFDSPAKVQVPIVTFVGAEPGGLVLRVTDGRTPVDRSILNTLRFSIEVSRIDIR